jgi:hypothetical protein
MNLVGVVSTTYTDFKTAVAQLSNPIIFVRVVSTSDFRIMAAAEPAKGGSIPFPMAIQVNLSSEPSTFSTDYPNVFYRGDNSVSIDTTFGL